MSQRASAGQPIEYPEIVGLESEISISHLMGQAGKIDVKSKFYIAANNFKQKVIKKTFVIGSHCSANFISNSGHSVSALHCLSKKYFSKIKNKFGVFYKFNRKFIGQEIEFPWQEKYQFSMANEEKITFTVVDAGSGFPDFESREFENIQIADVKDNDLLNSLNQDFVILKMKSLPETHLCSKTGEKSNSGDLIWNTGYPVQTDGARNSTHFLDIGMRDLHHRLEQMQNLDQKRALQESVGQLRQLYKEVFDDNKSDQNSFLQAEAFRNNHPLYLSVGRSFRNSNDMVLNFNWPFVEKNFLIDFLYPENQYFVSTTSGAPGMSGGGTFNTSGELIGINIMLYGGSKLFKNFSRGIRHISIEYVKEKVSQNFNEQYVNDVFSCEF